MIMKRFKEVSKEERWDFVKGKNVSYNATGDFPYTGEWRDRSGAIVAKDIPEGKHLGISTDKYRHYILAD